MSPAFPAGNYSPRRNPPRVILCHHTVTQSPEDTRRVLTRRGLSTHFEVGKDGTVYGYLDPATISAWSAGRGNNQPTIAIDFTHMTGEPFPQAQIDSGAKLVQSLGRIFALPLVLAPAGQKMPMRQWLDANVTLLRHNNVRATICPDGLPMEDLANPYLTMPEIVIDTSQRGAGGGGIALGVLAVIAALAA